MNYGKVTHSYLKNAYVSLMDRVHPDRLVARNRELMGRNHGQRCFVLGSGSSIKRYDLTRLSGESVMTQNNFFVHDDIATIGPSYHCTVPYYQPDEQTTWLEWIEDMHRALPDATFFWGSNTRPLIEHCGSDLARKSYYLHTRFDVLTLRRARVDISRTVMTVPTVLTECLTVAMYLGFTTIILLGFDYDQICSTADQNFNRFYGLSKITDTSTERAIDKRLTEESAERWYSRWLNIKQLVLIREYAQTNNIEIVNGSAEGILNVFPRRPVGHDFENA